MSEHILGLGALPDWFRPGAKFRDLDGDPCIVLGWTNGEWRYAVLFLADPDDPDHLNWHAFHADRESDFRDLIPGWTPEQERELGGWK